MDNYDLKKDLRQFYAAKKTVEVVDVPPIKFLMAVGEGNPNTSKLHADAVEALYTVSYGVRAVAIEVLGRKHTVGPLEGLWWAADLHAFTSRDEDAWHWQMMIAQPEWVTDEFVAAGTERALAKKDVREADRLKFDCFTEGLAAQVLYVGPYDAEGPTIERMHEELVPENGYKLRGSHHEIYLSDARRTAPERLRTILRQPVEAVDR